MNRYTNNSIKINELMVWKRNQLTNPKTNRKIKKNGITFRNYHESYHKFFPNGYDIFDSNDEKDPISLNHFYQIDKSGNKLLVHSKPEELILYQESDNIIRCFEKRSLSYLKKYNINTHPISQKIIPLSIINSVEEIDSEETLSVEQVALNVFQLFTKISIFIDYKLFLKLEKGKLKRFNYELKDFYYQNISLNDRKQIDKSDGKKILSLQDFEIEKLEITEAQLYLLNQIELLLKVEIEELKFMINYIILGALSLFIPEVKEIYDNFNFSF